MHVPHIFHLCVICDWSEFEKDDVYDRHCFDRLFTSMFKNRRKEKLVRQSTCQCSIIGDCGCR